MLNLTLPPTLAEKREKVSEEKAKAAAGVKESYGMYHFEQGAKDAESKGNWLGCGRLQSCLGLPAASSRGLLGHIQRHRRNLR
jgi:hypothetical protein